MLFHACHTKDTYHNVNNSHKYTVIFTATEFYERRHSSTQSYVFFKPLFQGCLKSTQKHPMYELMRKGLKVKQKKTWLLK